MQCVRTQFRTLLRNPDAADTHTLSLSLTPTPANTPSISHTHTKTNTHAHTHGFLHARTHTLSPSLLLFHCLTCRNMQALEREAQDLLAKLRKMISNKHDAEKHRADINQRVAEVAPPPHLPISLYSQIRTRIVTPSLISARPNPFSAVHAVVVGLGGEARARGGEGALAELPRATRSRPNPEDFAFLMLFHFRLAAAASGLLRDFRRYCRRSCRAPAGRSKPESQSVSPRLIESHSCFDTSKSRILEFSASIPRQKLFSYLILFDIDSACR